MVTVHCRGLVVSEVPFYVGAYYVDLETREVYLGVEFQTTDKFLYTLVSLQSGRCRIEPQVVERLSELTKGVAIYYRPCSEDDLGITLVK